MAGSPIASVWVAVMPETSRIASGIRDALRGADKDVVEAARRWKGDIERELKDVKTTVKADTTDAKLEIDRLGDKDVTVRVKADTTGLPPILGGGGSGGGFGGGGGGALGLNAGLVGVGLLPAASTAVANLAGALQQLAGAGAVMPGVFAGLASSIGVAKLSTQGMSDAFDAVTKASDGTKASVDAANKALADLSPNAAETVKSVVGLKGTFTDLRNIGSQNMFAGVSGGLRELAGNLLPTATRGVDGISRALNQNLLGAMTSLGSDSSQGLLGRIFGNTADAQGRLTAAIDPAVHAIGTLAAAGSDSLPRLADAVGKVAERFNAFITSADGDGRLQKWISEGLDGFTHLGNIALDLGKSFTAITQAAGGGTGLLGTLDSLTGRMSAFLNSAQGQAQLRDFFTKGAQQLGQLRDIAVQLGPVLSGVFQSGLSAANLWLPVIRQALDILNRIPGGAEGVVTAFVAWKTIQGPVQLLNSITNISTALGGLGGRATGAVGAINKAFAGIVLPAGLLEALHFQQTSARADDLANGRTANAPIGPRGLPVGAKPADPAHFQPDPANNMTPLWQQWFGPDMPPSTFTGGGGNFGPAPGSISSDTLARKDDMTGVAAIAPSVPIPALSTYSPPVVTDPGKPTAFSAGGISGMVVTPENVMQALGIAQSASGKPYGYGGVGPGSMSDQGPGLYDCSGFMSDLYASLTGKPLNAGERYFTTESDFSKLGFVEGYDPSSVFNIGVHNGGGGKNSHMAGTLNGVNVESGGNGTLYGGKAKGALDPEFEKQYHLPSSMYGGLSMAGSSKNSPMYVMPADEKAFGGNDAKQLGSDFMSGILQIFGVDGSLFADPTQFGITKFLSGAANLKFANGGGTGGGLPGMPSGGGGGLAGLLGLAGNFMPGMPGGNSQNLLDAVQFKAPGGPGSPGPGNVNDQSIVFNGPVGVDPNGLVQDIQTMRLSQNRYAPLMQNLPR